MNVKPRRYRSPQRAAQANATRRQILAAATTLFASRGFARTTMESIAGEAGVAVATVYVHFPGKPAIVAALADDIVAAGDLSVEQVEQERDAVTQLRIGASVMRRLNERAWLVVDVLRTARATDPALDVIWQTWLERHLTAMRRAVAALAGQGALRPGLDVAEAVDILYALTSTDVFRLLVTERGWPPERYEAWLFRTACADLLGSGSVESITGYPGSAGRSKACGGIRLPAEATDAGSR